MVFGKPLCEVFKLLDFASDFLCRRCSSIFSDGRRRGVSYCGIDSFSAQSHLEKCFLQYHHHYWLYGLHSPDMSINYLGKARYIKTLAKIKSHHLVIALPTPKMLVTPTTLPSNAQPARAPSALPARRTSLRPTQPASQPYQNARPPSAKKNSL